MDYEQKYNDILIAVKKLQEANPNDEGIQNWIDDNFPELKKSENELTWLTKYIEEEAYYLSIDIRDNEDRVKLKKLQKALAWLEKQGEQKPVDKVEPKFKMEKGKWYVCDTSRYTDFIVGKAYYCPKNEMLKPNENAIARYVARDCFHLWTIQDAKDGDVLMANAPFIFNGNLEGGIGCPGAHCGINTLGDFKIPEYTRHWTGHTTTPATKEQRDLLFKKMHEGGYEWDVEKKELKKIEQEPVCSDKKLTDVNHEYFSELLENDDSEDINDYAYQVAYCMSHDWIEETATWDDVQKACKLGAEWNEKHHKSAWSEENEKIYQSIIDDTVQENQLDGKQINWLKSLKDRYTWKPSDEQIKALKETCDEHWEPDGLDPLYSLLEQLKKLKENKL